jgi:four helix bundle protein
MKIFSFEKLKVWQKSKELSKLIYQTTATFPEEEKFGMISQMRRSSISISSSIAEGTGRHGKKDKARFTEIAYGSSLELLNQVIISHELSFLHENQHEVIRNSIEEITKMLDGLHKSQLN